MAKPTPTKTRAPRRSAEQIARDDVAMTTKKVDLVSARLQRLAAETAKAEAEHTALTALLHYQSAHPLLTQPTLDEGTQEGA